MINKNTTQLNISNFGTNLWKAREERKMSRQALADLIGLSDQRIIYDYENGVKNPSIDRLIKIANALGVELDSMFR